MIIWQLSTFGIGINSCKWFLNTKKQGKLMSFHNYAEKMANSIHCKKIMWITYEAAQFTEITLENTVWSFSGAVRGEKKTVSFNVLF